MSKKMKEIKDLDQQIKNLELQKKAQADTHKDVRTVKQKEKEADFKNEVEANLQKAIKENLKQKGVVESIPKTFTEKDLQLMIKEGIDREMKEKRRKSGEKKAQTRSDHR